MGKKAEKPKEEPKVEEPKEDEEESIGELLQGEFIFQDGSTYTGQYLKTGEAVCLHGEGLLKTGPESFQGVFEKGAYKVGRYTSCTGAVYSGHFRENRFHGVGEYTWPMGKGEHPTPPPRVYRGLWREGYMHGCGEFLNFSIGADKAFSGFALRGEFKSGKQEQEEAARAFKEEYASECKASASAALRDLAERAHPERGATRDYVVPPLGPDGLPPPEESPRAAADRAAAEDAVLRCDNGFPEAAVLVQASAQAFAARLAENAERPLQVTVFEDRAGLCGHFEVQRLRRPQLQHAGQAVGFVAFDAEPGAISVLVLANTSAEFDLARATWKVVHCEVLPPVA